MAAGSVLPLQGESVHSLRDPVLPQLALIGVLMDREAVAHQVGFKLGRDAFVHQWYGVGMPQVGGLDGHPISIEGVVVSLRVVLGRLRWAWKAAQGEEGDPLAWAWGDLLGSCLCVFRRP